MSGDPEQRHAIAACGIDKSAANVNEVAIEVLMAPNAGVKPPCGGAADMCKRSVKHMADATTRGRLERLVRREGSRRG